MAIPKLAAKFETTLASGISATATTATLASAQTKDGFDLTAGTYGFTIDEGSSDEEFIIATVSGTSMTSIIRGLSYQDGATSLVALKKTHRKGAQIKITDHPALLYIVEVIAGRQPFEGVIKNPTNRVISDPRHIIDKEYADGLSSAGIASFMVTNGTGLTFNISAGTYVDGGTVYQYAGASAVSLTASQTNYVSISAGVLQVNTTGFIGVPIYTIVTDGAGITSKTDNRPFLSYGTLAGVSTSTPNSSGYLTGGTSPSATTVFDTLASSGNNGKIKAIIDGVTYDNIAVDVGNYEAAASVKDSQLNVSTNWYISTNVAFLWTISSATFKKLTSFSFWANNAASGTYTLTIGSGSTPGVNQMSSTTFTTVLNSQKNTITLSSEILVVQGQTYWFKFTLVSGSDFYVGGYATGSGSVLIGGSPNGYKPYIELSGKGYIATDTATLAANLQAAIRATTGKTETVAYVTNKYVVTSSTTGPNSSVAKLATPSTGVDISGNNATRYFDLGANATATVGTSDVGKVPKLDNNGKLPTGFMPFKFGGNGSDGALNISSGTVTIDCGGAAYFEKNYSSISITGTGALVFTNPHANGTTVRIRSASDITLTSSAAPMIDVSGMGAAGGAIGTGVSVNNNSGSGTVGGNGTNIDITGSEAYDAINHFGLAATSNSLSSSFAGGVGGLVYGNMFPLFLSLSATNIRKKIVLVKPGAGGAGGSGGNAYSFAGGYGGNGGIGGRGGGALIIECAGSWNFTTANGISVAGANGATGTAGSGNGSCWVASGGGGGGGGAGGMCVVLYNALIANTGTIKISGGTGGNGGTNSSGGSGGSGGYYGANGGGGGGFINAGGNGGANTAGTTGASGTVGGGATGGAGGTGSALVTAGAASMGGAAGGGGGAAGNSLVLLNTEF